MLRMLFSTTAIACCLSLTGGILFTAPVQARVTQIIITQTESPTFGGRNFGAVGAYERISGQIIGEVDPRDPLNAIIVDIGLAPKNPNGTVTYSTDFQILRPVDRAKGNKRLIYEITNRGRTNVLGTLNDSKTENDVESSGDAGNGFLMRQGYAILESGWDFSAPRNGKLFTMTVPVAKNPDGSPITGLNTEEFVIDKAATPALERLTYPAASADKSKASLTVRRNYADTPVAVPASEWDYVDAKLNAVKLTSGNFGGPGSFGPTALYEFTYEAKDPVVAGLGFAAIRDIATFLRNAETDDKGTPNPLAGDAQYIYSFCSSQPCRTMHDFVQLGFNQPEQPGSAPPKTTDTGLGGAVLLRTAARAAGAAPVFDGVLNWKAGGSGLFLNYRFSQPVRTHRQHIGRWTPEYQFPFADVKVTDTVTGKTDWRLRRCEESGTCPKIFEANSSNEYWAKASSMMQTDSQGHDLDLSGAANVRYYLLASLPHGAGNGPGICAQPRNPLRPNAVLRALLTDLDAWVTAGTAPPSNQMPRVADGTLAPPLPQESYGFPRIPGVVYNGAHHTGDLWDFGPGFDKGFLSVLPPKLAGQPYPVFVPKADADGNDIAGIRVPEVAVPVATYTGWALRADGLDGCDASGQKLNFAKTKAARLAAGDPRLSLEERYAHHAAYVERVSRAAQALKDERFLLDEDVHAYVEAAQAANVP
ncbi:MAG TPA: alpha/beta hydrolase domain-containing protein [Xanthobacteraceae bacterium]|nr:alpha/beta hydrolase domain-containing protein [Xanthobacteraceae bacterium]